MELKSSIRQQRKQRGLTQEQLAEAMGVSPAAVSKWENGQSIPDITMLAALADFFEISIDALVNYQVKSHRREEMIERFRALTIAQRDDEAVEVAREALRRYPNHFDVVYGCAKTLSGRGMKNDCAGDLREAIALLDQAMTLLDQDSAKGVHRESLLNRKGMCYSALKDYDAAIACYEAGNVSGINQVSLGECYLGQERYDEALPALSEGLMSHMMGSVSAATGLMSCLARRDGGMEEALSLSAWCIKMLEGLETGTSSMIWRLKALLLTCQAILYAMHGQDETAARTLDKAVEAAAVFDAQPRYDLNSVRYYYGRESALIDNRGETAMDGIRSLLTERENAADTTRLLKLLDEMEGRSHDRP